MDLDDRYQPATIDVDRAASVSLTYADGHAVCFDIMTLRQGCPCATCRNLRERGEDVWPRPGSPNPLRITDARLHGAWGLSITWNDGHATGIFPFAALRRWSDSGAAPDGWTSDQAGAATAMPSD